MKITFDPPKRAIALRERGIDFEVDAAKVFNGRTATNVDDRFDYGERRLKTVGWLSGRMVVIIWTERGLARHIISMRYCHAEEELKLSRQFDRI